MPPGEFPNVNDRGEIKKTVRKMTRGAYFILGAAGVVLAGLVYGGTLLFG